MTRAQQLQGQAYQAYRTACALARGRRPEAAEAFQEVYRLVSAARTAREAEPRKEAS